MLQEKIPNLGLVVSVLEDFELNGKVLAVNLKIQSPTKWQAAGVKHHQLIATDFTADMAIDDTLKTLMIMDDIKQQGKSTYIHCKAGRGRSVTVVILYLLLYGCLEADIEPKINLSNLNDSQFEKEIKALYEFIKTKRTQVNLKEHNFEKINQVVNITTKNGFPLKPEHNLWEVDTNKVDLKKHLHECLASLDAKEEIAQFNSFKHLKFYAIDNDNSNRKSIIQNFLNNILNAKDAAWYFSLFNHEGPAQQLLDARPMYGFFGQGKPNRRIGILEDFKKDVNEWLAHTLQCSVDDLEGLMDMYRVEQEHSALKKAN